MKTLHDEQKSCCVPTGRDEISPLAAAQTIDRGRSAPPDRLVEIPGGIANVGTRHAEIVGDGESPIRKVKLKPFRIDPFAVTTRWFGEFISDTGYRTDAETYGWSLVFHGFAPEVDNPQYVKGTEWWQKVDGANWAHPFGPNSALEGYENHPVTHVSWNDAAAFADWAGGRLATEAEWEHAARGGVSEARFPWGNDEPDDADHQPCNIWQGEFPHRNTVVDGFAGTAPVDAYEGNGYGLFNMSGNVWEWCADAFRIRSLRGSAKRTNASAAQEGRKLAKGGSYLCHKSYCYRYRIAGRTGVTPDTSSGHMGFRVIFDVA